MTKTVIDSAHDALLLQVVQSASHLVINDAAPANFAAAVGANALGSIAISPGDGGGDFTLANGDTSGRKYTLAQQTGISINSTGNANHVSIVNSAAAALLVTTELTSQSVTLGNTATVNAFDHEVGDPT